MILSKAYDVEILPNFFSIVIVDVNDYLRVFADACEINKKGKKSPIPLVQKYSVKEITERLTKVKKNKFYITDTDDSQLLQMLGCINDMRPHYENITKNGQLVQIPVRIDMFGYNSNKYDRLMVAGLLMFANQTNTTKELITKLYELSKKIIETQDNPELAKNDYFLKTLRDYKLPYVDVDIMTIFALNKVGKGVNAKGETVYFGKSLKQTSINLQWYELLEHELPPISELDYNLYQKQPENKGLTINQLNRLIDKWDRFMIDEWIPDVMHYNENDVFIVCEMIRLYMDEIKLRYSISNAYDVDVLSSSRSNIADKMFIKFYSEFSGLSPQQWRGKTTERTAMAFKKVILPFIKFKTPELQQMLEEMKKVIIYSIGKDAFMREIKLGNLVYTIATGGLHSQDIPRELKSKLIYIDSPSTGDCANEVSTVWNTITDDSYIYVHYDISDAVSCKKLL